MNDELRNAMREANNHLNSLGCEHSFAEGLLLKLVGAVARAQTAQSTERLLVAEGEVYAESDVEPEIRSEFLVIDGRVCDWKLEALKWQKEPEPKA